MENTEEIYPDKMLRGISSFAFIEEGILRDDAYQLLGMIIKMHLML